VEIIQRIAGRQARDRGRVFSSRAPEFLRSAPPGCRAIAHPPAREGLRPAGLWPIVAGRHGLGDPQERTMSHQPPKESKKKPQHTPKEKKTIKQQKKHASDTAPFIKH
jgi:hypothetical protein